MTLVASHRDAIGPGLELIPAVRVQARKKSQPSQGPGPRTRHDNSDVARQSGANKVYTQLPHFVYGQVLLPLYQATDNFRHFFQALPLPSAGPFEYSKFMLYASVVLWLFGGSSFPSEGR